MNAAAVLAISLLVAAPFASPLIVLWAGALGSLLHAQPAGIAIRAGAMVDVERGTIVRDAVVIVRGERIIAAGSSSDVPIPTGIARIDLPTTTLLPGLIDAHVHLTLGAPAAVNARATLSAGFTTVQDLGSAPYANIMLRDAIRAGTVEGPRVVASGPWLGITGGTCDFNGIGVRGAEAFRKRVRDDVEHGADLIKVCVSGWLADAVQDPAKYEITNDELQAAIDEAHGRGKRVAVHALSEAGIGAAVRLGADLVVHAGFPSPATVAVMKERHLPQLPTLFSLSTAPAQQLAALRSHMRTAVSGGLPIAFGTDAGVIPHGDNAREFEQLSSIGLDAPAALRAATVFAARAVGMEGDVGVLAAGRLADVVGVEGNPLEDLRVLQRMSFVMKAGKVVKSTSAAARP
jgi:imidazolonepropionase-like amidohydrolase